MKKLTLLFLCLCLGFFSPAPASACDLGGKVIHVSDGDTLKVLVGKSSQRIRLFGIDSPEREQAFYTQAKRFTENLAKGKTVKLHIKDFDPYGRIVADVILPNGKSLSEEITKAGYAWWYQRYAPNNHVLKNLEKAARKKKHGLWADKNPIEPAQWKRSQGKQRKWKKPKKNRNY